MDFDVAEHELAKCLTLMPDIAGFGKFKYIFWTNNSAEVRLHRLLDVMVEIGLLESIKRGQQYRWNPTAHGFPDLWQGSSAAAAVIFPPADLPPNDLPNI